mmetsp:Transcript_10025/g.18020  ORF Transcript_10025/g.18020 Transcript_10025/m.18020 type:complete len:241 (+) Transcript_10025:284-1006(+)|eukprot:CAMPEP_0201645070 /NCGR_PEP_ID=MMETSP0493-20130528/31354_1 /ASSEMBLY_ACC=CAM_ASM_000838 /TAXON_ID=420259 /ORGANISM="Thalassiosira gravida, Strain GMp14c1" /LENGTH=240 /DNA_ID=CAMNT_0048119919 /DNA_START=169 /DNA_END=891 /DNA_ORIENTATION=+
MKTILTFALLSLCLCNVFFVANGECLTEDDLDFEVCDLEDLKDDVLSGICSRIGLDMTDHVLPYLYEDEEEDKPDGDETDADATTKTTTPRTYTHDDYVQGAEECLMIEEEMTQMELDDPDYLTQLERDALIEDPEIVAEVIADVLSQSESSELLKEIASTLMKEAAVAVHNVEGMLEEGEALEERPDVVGYIIAKLLSEDDNLDILGELDDALAKLVEDWHEEEHYEEWQGLGGGEDEL